MYEELDKRIIDAIKQRSNPIYNHTVKQEAARIAVAAGREDFRVIDGRLQALKKAGKIRHLTKAQSNGQGGWHVVPQTVSPDLPDERPCCGTFKGSPHRATCAQYRGKFKPYNPDTDPTAGKPWPVGLDAGRVGTRSKP